LKLNLNSKRVILTIITITLFAFTGTAVSSAQVDTGIDIDQLEEFNFELLGYEDVLLSSPSDAASFFFSLPANWELTKDVTLALDLGIYFSESDASEPLNMGAAFGSNSIGGVLEIRFNNLFLTSIPLTRNGRITEEIILPKDLFIPETRQRIHVLFNTERSCFSTHESFVVVHQQSTLNIPHSLVELPTDLAQFPFPIYQRSFGIDEALIIVPDQASKEDLQASLVVAAALGRHSEDTILIDVRSEKDLLAPTVANSHLIFIGVPEKFSTLTNYNFSMLTPESGFDYLNKNEADGVLLLGKSIFNEYRAALLVSGNNDEGVLKSALALSNGIIRPKSIQGDVAIIKEINSDVSNTASGRAKQSFTDLGYDLEIVRGAGSESVLYNFVADNSVSSVMDGTIKVEFTHSALLNPDRSSMVVYLNGKPIGSSRLLNETANEGVLDLRVPANLIRKGKNSIEIEFELRDSAICADGEDDNIWAAVWPESILSLVYDDSEHASITVIPDLVSYPLPYTLSQTLDRTTFIIPRDDLDSWRLALKLTSDLANLTDGDFYLPNALFEDSLANEDIISESDISESDIILIGQPSMLTSIETLNNAFVVPYSKTTNLAVEDNLPVAYDVSAKSNLGYLQMITSPWNTEKTLLHVSGSSVEGMQFAAQALVFRPLRNQLRGSFDFVTETVVEVGLAAETNSLGGDNIPNYDPDNLPNPDTVVAPNDQVFGWLLPVIVGSSIAIALLIIYLFITKVFMGRGKNEDELPHTNERDGS
jgi:hypothetical protein